MQHLYLASIFFLSATVILSLVGGMTNYYRENWGECVAFFLLTIGCASRIPDLWWTEYVPLDWFLVHAGIGLFFISNALKTFAARHPEFFQSMIESSFSRSPASIAPDLQWQLYDRTHGDTTVHPPERRRKA